MSVVIAFAALCVIILVHEFGHFGAARMFGMKVYEFNLGLGPILLKKKRGDTQWAIRAFPIGGSCQLGEDENPGEDDDNSALFRNRPVWQRIIVIAAGAFLNMVLGLILAIVIGIINPISTLTIGGFREFAISNSGDSALQVGDEIQSINGMRIISNREISYKLENTLMSGAGESEYTLTVGMFGLNAVSNTGDYALAVGDRIVSINGTEIRSAVQIYNELAQVAAMGVSGSVVVNEGAANESEVSYVESVFVVMREIDGVPMRVTLTRARTPFRTESSGEQSHIRDFFVQTAYEFVVIRNGERVTLPNVTFPAAPNSRGGISCVDDFRVFGIFEEQKTFVNVMSYSFRDCVSMGRIIWLSLADLLRGTYGLNDLSGPVGIGAAVSGAAEHTENFGEMIMMIVYISAFITINLGVVNLLPIPALDGGRLIFLTLEGIRRKPIKQEYETIIHVVGLVLLILLIVVITFNDIRNLFAG